MGQQPYETPVERAIREAQEAGAFDNLPGAGKPLRGLDRDDPDWWVKQYAEREQLDLSGALSPALALRKEKAGFPQSLRELSTEASVRVVLEDYNRRVKYDRLRPAVGPRSPVIAGLVDVEDMVEQWRRLRTVAAAGREMVEDGPPAAPEARGPRRGRWWWPFGRQSG